MKKICFGFLLLVGCLLISTVNVDARIKRYRHPYINITIDFSTVPETPGVQQILVPNIHQSFVVDWNALRVERTLGVQATFGNCVVGGLGDYATFNDNFNELQYFFFGNGVLWDFILHGPAWCDAGTDLFNSDNFYAGQTTYLDLGIASLPTNAIFKYTPSYLYGSSGSYGTLTGLTLRDTERFQVATSEDWFWGLWDPFGSSAGGWATPPSMGLDLTVGEVVYDNAHPLVVQYARTDITVSGTSTGSITFRIPIIFL